MLMSWFAPIWSRILGLCSHMCRRCFQFSVWFVWQVFNRVATVKQSDFNLHKTWRKKEADTIPEKSRKNETPNVSLQTPSEDVFKFVRVYCISFANLRTFLYFRPLVCRISPACRLVFELKNMRWCRAVLQDIISGASESRDVTIVPGEGKYVASTIKRLNVEE